MTVTLAKSAMTVLPVAATALASVPAWALHLEDHDRNVIKTVAPSAADDIHHLQAVGIDQYHVDGPAGARARNVA
jgi:hypothetical protein